MGTNECMIIAIIAMLALTVGACAESPTGEAIAGKETVKIGVIGALSGDSAVFGTNTKAGVEFALDQLNEKETRYRYEAVFEDDQLDNAKTVAAYHKLKSIDRVDAVIGATSGSGNAIAALAEQDRVLFCSIASDPAIVAGRTYVFKHWTTPEAEAQRFIEEVEKEGWRRIVIFEANQQGAKAIFDVVEELAGTRGISVDRHPLDTAVKDARNILLKYRDGEVDAFVLGLLPDNLASIAKQIKEFGFAQPLTTIETFEYLTADLDLLEGEWYINSADPQRRFTDAYEAATGETPGVMVPNAYDCVNILVKGFEEAGRDPAKAATVIHTLRDYDGAMGTLYYDAGSIESPAMKKKVKDGKFVVAE